MLKTMIKAIAIAALFTAVPSHADKLEIFNGSIIESTGALKGLTPAGTEFGGSLDYNEETLSANYTDVILGGFCFNTTVTGQPAASDDCPGVKTAVPFLAHGQTSYDPAPPPANTNYLQQGSEFSPYDGGLFKLLAYSPSFDVNILIDIELFEDGNATLSADAGFLGTTYGEFTWDPKAPPVIVPVPASLWFLISAITSLIIVRSRRS